MKRWLVLALLLASTGTASPRRVVHMPTLPEVCPSNAEWDKLDACIRRHGTMKVLRDEPALKIIDLDDRMSRFGGIYVYAFKTKWDMRGTMRLWQEHDVLGVQHVTYGKHKGIRFDVGLSTAMPFTLDGETSMQGVLRQQETMVCFEDAWGCLQAITSCELLMRGKAYYSFRGTLAYADKQLQIVGDRSRSGTYCTSPEIMLQDQ
ncbi:MAG TPA: hypothetical protein VFV99_07545 [Kofleriaceae bacterium]|nr:hypothetical protein [Kofleriaceae bacterium]